MQLADGQQVIADSVLEEYEMAKGAGAFILPVGATGGAAKQIADQLLGSDIPSSGSGAQRPTDKEIVALSEALASTEELLALINRILGRLAKDS